MPSSRTPTGNARGSRLFRRPVQVLHRSANQRRPARGSTCGCLQARRCHTRQPAALSGLPKTQCRKHRFRCSRRRCRAWQRGHHQAHGNAEAAQHALATGDAAIQQHLTEAQVLSHSAEGAGTGAIEFQEMRSSRVTAMPLNFLRLWFSFTSIKNITFWFCQQSLCRRNFKIATTEFFR